MTPSRAVRSLLPVAFLAPALLAPGCVAAPTGSRGIALDDPLGLVMDVARAGNPLRVYVLPSSTYVCQPTTGTLNMDIPDLPAGMMVPDAVVDISATINGDMATAMAVIPVGDWTVLVRGKGTDTVSGRMGRIIATGCATVAGLGANETRSVNITLLPQHDMGMCGDGLLSPDEQCEPSLTPANCAMCRTTPLTVSTLVHATPEGPSHVGGGVPHVSSTTGQRVALAWTSNSDIGFRALDIDAHPLTSPGAFATDATLDSFAPQLTLPGPQIGGYAAVAPDGRIAVAETDLVTPPDSMGDVKVAFFSNVPAAQSIAPVRTSAAGNQGAPSAAFSGSGALMVVFEDSVSATGISGRVFASGATTPSGAEAFPVGNGQTGGSHPIVAGLATGFVVVFSSGPLGSHDVWYQRYDAAGMAMDATPVAVLAAADAAGDQDQASVAANADGSFLVAWNDRPMTTIRARPFMPNGMPAAAALVVPSTAPAPGSAPSVAAADGRYFIAWVNGASVYGRVLSGMGSPLPNREQPQTASDFVVAAAGSAPSVCAMGAMPASWLVAYASGSDIFARRYPR